MEARWARLQDKFGQGIFAFIVIGLLLVMFGPAVHAEFARRDGNLGWGYGYGYGWAYGDENAWDHGTYAGYLVEEHFGFVEGELLRIPPYGYGYGLLLSHVDDAESSSYDSETGVYEISADDMGSLHQSGLTTILLEVGKGSLNDAVAIGFAHTPVRFHVGNHTILFELSDIPLRCDVSHGTAGLIVSSSFSTAGLSSVRGKAAFAFEDGSLTCSHFVSEGPLFRIFVGSSFNDQELSIAQRFTAEDDWNAEWGSCVIADGFCEFEVSDFATGEYLFMDMFPLSELGYFAVHGGVSSGGSSSPPNPDPTVSLTYPTGGQTFAGGSSATITWSTTGSIYRSRLSYSSNSGSSWSLIADDLSGTTYDWTVPSSSTTDGRIRVEGLNSSLGVVSTSMSASDFNITMPGDGSGTPPPPGTGTPPPPGTGTPPPPGGSSSGGAMPRSQANARLPFDAQVDSLVKIPSDNNPATEVDATVYYIGLDALRHPFPSAPVFFSWYQDFRDVRPVSAATLASIPLGEPVLVRPGTHWVKIISDPKTYFVEPGYRLRWIKDEATARLLGGPDWNRNILDVAVSLFTEFSVGADIDQPALASDWPSGALVKATGAPEVFYITPTGRRHVVSEAAMQANHFQMRFVTTTGPDAGWVHKALGTVISGLEDALFSLMH